MTVTDTREPSRNYPVPAPGNNGADDIARLITALTMVGADVAALIAALSGKAATAHGHAPADITGLVDALTGKAASGHTHGLDDLSDVEASGQAAYQVLAWIAGRWAPWTVDLAHVAGNGVLRLDGPQTLSAAEKLQGRSNLAAAPLDSPEFTGAPKVPTVAVTADSTAAANVTMLRTAVAGLVGASPAALDTLVELAAALGNDANFSATMTAALAARLRVDAAQGLSTGQQAQGRENLALDNFRQSGNNGGFGSTAGTGVKFRVRGAIDWTSGNSYGLYVDPSPPDGASAYIGVYSIPVMGAAPAQTVLTHFQAGFSTISASAITNVHGYYATASLGGVGTSVNCGFRGSLGAGAQNWNLYMDGAAPNYMVGSLGIGASVPTCALDVRGPVRCGSFTRTTLPSASVVGAGAMAWCTNPASGVARAFWSTGTDWRDGANVAA